DELARVAPLGGVERRQSVVAHPVQVRASFEEEFGDRLLSAVTGKPESVRNLFGRRSGSWIEVGVNSMHESERGRLPETRPRPTLDQSIRSAPLAESDRVR